MVATEPSTEPVLDGRRSAASPSGWPVRVRAACVLVLLIRDAHAQLTRPLRFGTGREGE
jgi:hypothetical protein